MGRGESPGRGEALRSISWARARLPSQPHPPTPGKPPRKGGGKSSFPEHGCRRGRVQAASTWQFLSARPGQQPHPSRLPRGWGGPYWDQRHPLLSAGPSRPSPSCPSPTLPSSALCRTGLCLPSEPRTAGTGPQEPVRVGGTQVSPTSSRGLSQLPGPGFPSGPKPRLCVRGLPWHQGHSPEQSLCLCSGSPEENK